MEIQDDLGAELQGRLEEIDEVNVAAKEVNAAEPTVFDDEEVTMTMAQTLLKMKVKKERLLDEQMAKRLHDEEVDQAAARKRQEQDDFKRAQELQQKYDQKQENIDWNIVAEQIQEKHLDNIRKYQSLKRKPISVAQASISDCAERNKVEFVAATLQGRALTWWNSQVATLGLDVAIGKSWGDIKKMMLEDFYPDEEAQRMEDKLRSLKLRDTDMCLNTHIFDPKRIQLKRDKSEQNRIKTGQKQEAWQSLGKSRAVSVDRARKTKENTKRMVKNANTVEKLLKF
nr:hypothetical protein [Tanacetum cinerariifolium]